MKWTELSFSICRESLGNNIQVQTRIHCFWPEVNPCHFQTLLNSWKSPLGQVMQRYFERIATDWEIQMVLHKD